MKPVSREAECSLPGTEPPRKTAPPAPEDRGLSRDGEPSLPPSTSTYERGHRGVTSAPKWGPGARGQETQERGSGPRPLPAAPPRRPASPAAPSCRSGSGRRGAPARGAEGAAPPARRLGPRPRSAGRRRGPPPAAWRHRPAKPPPHRHGQGGGRLRCWPPAPRGAAGQALQPRAPPRPPPPPRPPAGSSPLSAGRSRGAGKQAQPSAARRGPGPRPTHPPSSSAGGVSSEQTPRRGCGAVGPGRGRALSSAPGRGRFVFLRTRSLQSSPAAPPGARPCDAPPTRPAQPIATRCRGGFARWRGRCRS